MTMMMDPVMHRMHPKIPSPGSFSFKTKCAKTALKRRIMALLSEDSS